MCVRVCPEKLVASSRSNTAERYHFGSLQFHFKSFKLRLR